MSFIKGIPQDIFTVLSNFSERIALIERSVRPIIAKSSEILKTHTIDAGNEYTAGTSTLTWTDSNIIANPGAMPMFEIYIDTDDDSNFLYPNGGSLTTAMRNFNFQFLRDGLDIKSNPYQNKFTYYIKNNDASQHTYYIHISYLYNANTSALTVA